MTRSYMRLNPDDWKALLGLYQTGVNTCEDLAARYGVSTSAIMTRARSAGVTRRSSFKAASYGIAAAASALTKLPPLIDDSTIEGRIRATTEAAYIGSLSIQRMLDASIAAFTVPTTSNEGAATIRALDQAASVLDRLHKTRRVALRMDTVNSNADTILPELPIRQMSNREHEALRAEQAREDQDTGTTTGVDASANLDVKLAEDDRLAEGCDA